MICVPMQCDGAQSAQRCHPLHLRVAATGEGRGEGAFAAATEAKGPLFELTLALLVALAASWAYLTMASG